MCRSAFDLDICENETPNSTSIWTYHQLPTTVKNFQTDESTSAPNRRNCNDKRSGVTAVRPGKRESTAHTKHLKTAHFWEKLCLLTKTSWNLFTERKGSLYSHTCIGASRVVCWRQSPLAPCDNRLLSRWVLHWCQGNGSTARWLFTCTWPLPSTRLDRPQISFIKSSV